MIAKKYARRTAAALVVPALLMTAACGGDDPGKNEVSGKPGDKPKVTLAKDAKPPKKVSVKTLDEGKGKAAAKGDFVRFDVLGKMTGDKEGKGQDLISTWNAKNGKAKDGSHTQMVTKLGAQQQMLPAPVTNALIGKKPGSRVQVEGTAKELLGAQQAAQTGMKPNTGMIWVLDVAAASKVDPKAEAKGDQAEVKSGLPQVEAKDKKAAKITVPKGQKPPEKLEQQTLIKGKGPEVKTGEGLVAQYTGVKWEDGKKFDSSWDHGGATGFQIGTKSVIPGWDKALAGKKVGDRVLLVAPPKEAYGATQAQPGQQQNPLAKNTLVFVVDIVGKV
ncbi:FKBP-type peptidyl-prolyl cis-trans isomerase [Streptomyces sp. ODS28]|uniref:FKBP-type peptidyl-prolyl cis-trans isomerase n=1 Tax=Streptomyces sp. ODS28 TaxID=3136688 RepID=UPI0031EC149F